MLGNFALFNCAFLQKFAPRIMEGMGILHNCSKFPENVTLLQNLDLLNIANWYREFTESNQVRKMKLNSKIDTL